MRFEYRLLILLLFALACVPPAVVQPPAIPQLPAVPRTLADDPHSFSEPDKVTIEHLGLSLGVDFPNKQLVGRATLYLDNKAATDKLMLDARDLDIRSVSLGPSLMPTRFRLGETDKFLGQPLTIDIAPDTRIVHIDYATRPQAAALQWLDPQQTAGKRHPFLFTQSQAILARTWIPLQDTPAVRFTYEAAIRVPAGLMAVMSADNPTRTSADGLYRFRMPQPVPSYLMALAVGDLEFRTLGERAGVYAEPSVVDQAANEFVDIPRMMEAADRLYGPYRWGRYDVLVLPPSFPFGGMENPRLTFATPTIIAGDRSLVSLIAHELAHSWSGNLVTNATWNDFWLNEGFTVYLERRIMEEVYGRDYAEMLASLGLQDLMATFEDLPPRDEHLKLDLRGRDPDEGLTDVAYEKGALFLRMLEKAVGRERFDAFLRRYFDTFAFQSMDSEGFLDSLTGNLFGGSEEQGKRMLVEQWVYGPGLPANAPVIRSERFAAVDREVEQFKAGTPPSQLNSAGWTTHEWLHFIRNLPKPLSLEQMARLDETFHFTRSGNSEILFAWLMRAIESRYQPAYPALERFLTSMGRRKFLKPLYEELAKTPEGRDMAVRIYRLARPTYHAVSRGTIDEILKWQD